MRELATSERTRLVSQAPIPAPSCKMSHVNNTARKESTMSTTYTLVGQPVPAAAPRPSKNQAETNHAANDQTNDQKAAKARGAGRRRRGERRRPARNNYERGSRPETPDADDEPLPYSRFKKARTPSKSHFFPFLHEAHCSIEGQAQNAAALFGVFDVI